MSMKGKDHTLMKAAASTDLLVCFPSRSILSSQLHIPPHIKRTNASSPLLRAPQTKQIDLKNAEPTSPKVSCAGQIKVSPKSNKGCKSGQSLIVEIERIHNKGKKQNKHWLRHLLSCLRGLRFDLSILCLNNLPNASDDGDDENNSNTLFSKWFMVLQENHNYDLCTRHRVSSESIAPPPNALLLMRCRSAPAKQLSVKAKDEVEKCIEIKDGRETTKKMKELDPTKKMKKKTKKECYVEMRETWFNARSKSWKM